jgi:hypothetical protein
VANRINLTRLHPSLFPLLAPNSNGRRPLPIYPASILGGLSTPTAKELDELAIRFADVVDVAEATGHETFESLAEQERTYALQKLLVRVIIARRLNSVRAAEFIRDRTLVYSTHRRETEKTERYQPARRKEILMNLASSVTGSVIIDWSPDEFKRVFGLATREEVDEYIRKAAEARDVITGIMKILTGIRDAKRETPLEVQQLTKRKEKV